MFTNDGKSIHYCSSKCRRNFKLGRDPRKINWVKRKKVKKKRKVVREKITCLPAQKEKKEVKKEEEVKTEEEDE